MKKVLYITWIIWIIAVCWSICYYFIISANLKATQQKAWNEVTQEDTFEKKKKCIDLREWYIDYLNYTRYHEKDSNWYFTEIWDVYIFYSPEYDSCIWAHRRYWNQNLNNKTHDIYSINDYLNWDKEIFYCTTFNEKNCLEKWEEKIKELWK